MDWKAISFVLCEVEWSFSYHIIVSFNMRALSVRWGSQLFNRAILFSVNILFLVIWHYFGPGRIPTGTSVR